MMSALLHALFFLPAAYCAAISIYLLAVTIAAHRPKARARGPRGTGQALPSFGVIIPAHNEELQIGPTVAAVLEQAYARERFDAYVLADNCTDNTAELASDAGAVVFERTDPENRGKGQALDWCLANHSDLLERHDAIVIIDADSIMDAGFLQATAETLEDQTVAAVQAENVVANPQVNWRTALTYAGFALINCVRSAGRVRLGGAAGLKGNGMVLRSDLLAHYGWPAHSVVEDMEFATRLLLDGHQITYCERAKVSSDMPAGRKEAESQRNRWEAGKVSVIARHAPLLLRAFLRRRQWRYLDACLDLATPPLSILVFGQGALMAASAFAAPYLFPIFVACGVMTVLHVVLGLRLVGAPRTVWLNLLASPLFLAWKLSLYAKFLVRPREKGWVRTTRDAEIRQKLR
ncbi:MAG: glycosyltransferase family 2 protein [Candidatus Hydrogenedentes bacterium]|nr:glycosyltransferase family 2 protein [Candidatus Hydrogenedentota bacterium]